MMTRRDVQRCGMVPAGRAIRVAAVMVASAGLAVSIADTARAQDAEPAPTNVAVPETKQAERRIRFSFSEAPYAQVLEVFSRQTGLPIIREADPPAGGLSFISAETYTLPEALEILNLNLRMHGLRLEREENFLYLRTLADAARRPTAVAGPSGIDGAVDPSEFLTLYLPLSNALAANVAEQIRPLVKEPGLVQSVDGQNMLIIVETAAQCRRLREIVTQIDAVRPADLGFRMFPLEHTEAGKIAETLRGLIPEREQVMTLDNNNQPRITDDVSKPPLRITPDERLNAVVVVGPAARMTAVEELVAMLDVTEAGDGGARTVRVVRLATLRPQDAATQVSALFRGLNDAAKPTVEPMGDSGKLLLVGSASQVEQVEALLAEIDPGHGAATPDAFSARVVPLTHIKAGEAENLLRRVLPPAQAVGLRLAPAPGGSGVVVAGESVDAAAIAELLERLDVPADVRREVRVVAMGDANVAAAVERARELDDLAAGPGDGSVETIIDERARSVTLVGDRSAVDRFARLLSEAGRVAPDARQSKSYELTSARPSELAERVQRLAEPMLAPTDGGAYVAPKLEPLDELGTLVVRALPGQFAVLDELIARLDSNETSERQLRVLPLRGPDPQGLVARAREVYEAGRAGNADPSLDDLTTEIDAASGKLLVAGHPDAVGRFARALEQAQQLLPPDRTTRIIELSQADAADVVGPLRELLASADPIDPAREVPEPTIRVVERTNALLVTAENAQHGVIADFVRRLDRIEPTDLPPLRLLQLRTADANSIARMLNEQYRKRPSADRTARPVEVRADGATNTLIVSAHADLFDEIKAFVEQLNDEADDKPERETVLFTLKVARAQDVASAMDRLYPQPPVPRDRYNRPMPWLQEEKEVSVSADPSTNALIIDAPTDRIKSLEELAAKLDRVEAPPSAQLRTFRVVNADLNAVASMLRGLASRGALAGENNAGRARTEVIIETEPASNALVVAGDEAVFAKVQQVLDSLTATPAEREVRIVPVANAEASVVAERAQAVYDAQVAALPDAGSVEVSVDASTNTLEIVADERSMERYLTVLEQLQDRLGPARELRLLTLERARVADVLPMLRELADASVSLKAGGGPAPVFEPVEATNSLMVAASPEQFGIVEQLVRGLDRRAGSDRPPLRILRLRSTDAAGIARVLSDSYESRPIELRGGNPVSIEADAATNTLIVSAHDEALAEIESIVRDLNDAQALDDEDREIRIFPLRVARAEELARTIDQMYPQPPVPRDARGRPRPDLQPAREIVVRADAATNSLIVDAPARRLAGFERIVESLDKADVSADIQVRTFRIKRADLDAAAEAVRTLAERGALATAGRVPITVTTEPRGRALIVGGPEEIFERVESLITELDGPPDRPATVLRLYALKHARAERLQALITDTLDARLRESQPGGDADALLEVGVDRGSNTLLISAPADLQKTAAELIEALDTEASAAGRSVLRVVPLSFADAGEVSRTVRDALGGIDLPAGGPVTVLAAASSNALLITGARIDVDRVSELVEPLDRRPYDPEETGVETFSLKHAKAERLRETLERLLIDERTTDPRLLQTRLWVLRGQLPDDELVRVEVDASSNSLMVVGPRSTLELARQVVPLLDRAPVDGDLAVTTFTPVNAEPAALVETVSRTLSRTVGDGPSGLELFAEPMTGAVVLSGKPADIDAGLAALRAVDARTVTLPQVEFRSVTLEQADARTAARTLASLLNDRGTWPASLRRAQSAGVTIASPSVQADERGNRVIVSAPSALMPIAEGLLNELDSGAAAGAVEVALFRLERGDAESVARALGEGLRAGAGPGEPEPRVTAEPTSNTVLVAAAPSAVERARTLVDQMDAVSAESAGVGVRTVFLKSARAETVAPIVERVLSSGDALEDMPDWMRFQVMRDYARRGEDPTEGAVRVAAEPRLNAIVVSGPRAALELAEQLATQLDGGGSGPGGDRPVRVIPLAGADADGLAESIAAVFEDDPGGDRPPVVRIDRAANALIVRGTQSQLETIERIAHGVDAAAVAGQRELRTIAIDRSRASADEVAQQIRRLMERRGGVRVEVISADELMAPADEADAEEGGEADRPFGEPSSSVDPPTIRPYQQPPRSRVIAAGLTRLVFASVGVLDASAGASQPSSDTDAKSAEDDDELPTVTLAVDPETNSIVVVGSPRVAERVAKLAAELERQMPAEPTAVRIVELPDGANADEIASLVSQTVRQVGRSSDTNPGGFTDNVVVRPDPEGNALIVWANDTDFVSVAGVVRGLARVDRAQQRTVKIYPLANVSADAARRAVVDLVSPNPVGRQAQRVRRLELTVDGPDGAVSRSVDASRVSVTTDPGGTAIIVSAPAEAMGLVDRFVELIDQSPVTERLAIRSYSLKSADANDTAGTLQQLFDAQRQNARDVPRARFVADDRMNAVLATASAAQHEEIARLIAESDVSLQSDESEVAVIPIEIGRPSSIARIVQEVIVGRDPARRDRVVITGDNSAGSIVVRAPEAEMAEVRDLVSQLDSAETASYPVRSIKLERADAEQVAQALQGFFQQRARVGASRGVAGARGDAAIIGDRRSGTLVIAASDEDYAQIKSLVDEFDAPSNAQQFRFRIIPLENARASDVGDTVASIAGELQWERSGWFRGNNQGSSETDRVFVRSNERSNSIVLFGQGETMDVLEGIVAELDAAPSSEKEAKTVRAVRAEGVDLNVIAQLVEEVTQSPNWQWWQGTDPDQVSARVDRRRGLLLLVGNKERVEQAAQYVKQLVADAGEGRIVESVRLTTAQASEVARAITSALPEGLDVHITPVPRNNLILLTGSPDSVAKAKQQIAELDTPRAEAPLEIQRFEIKHADAYDAASDLRTLVRNRPRGQDEPAPSISTLQDENAIMVTATKDAMAFIADVVKQLDVPSGENRQTEFVKLEFASAEQAGDALRVFYGRYAREATTPAERNVTIVPDPASNSLVISAAESIWPDLRALLEKLDVPEYDTSLQLVVIPLEHASASSVARALNEGFRAPLEEQLRRERVRLEAQQGQDNNQFREPAVLVDNEGTPTVSAEPQTNSLIVFAGRRELERIRAIVQQLDVPALRSLPPARVVPLRAGVATSIAEAARRVFVRESGGRGDAGPTEVLVYGDDTARAVIVRASDEAYAQIVALVRELESEAAAAEPMVRVVRLSTSSAQQVQQTLQRTFGPLARQRGEQFSVQVDAARNALVIAASDRTQERVEAVVRELDGGAGFGAAEPADSEKMPAGEQNSAVIRLRKAEAPRVVAVLEEMLDPSRQDANTGPANALAEQVRRLSVQRGVRGEDAIALDLAMPIRVQADPSGNAVIVSSSAANVEALREIVSMLDTLPLGDDVVVRVLPLERAPAVRVKTIVDDLFSQGARLQRVPGTRREGAASNVVGRALASEIAVTLDERTNAVVVAGREEAVGLVEALVHQLDGANAGGGWIEATIVPLTYADPVRLAEKLRSVFVDGLDDTPEADALRRQVGRLRVAAKGGDGTVETELYGSLGGLAIVPEEDLRALIIVGSPANINAVGELVKMLDVEQADAAGSVRVMPLRFASADRVATIVRDVFRDRAQLRGARPEDRVVVSVDGRTNALIISTSPRSFELLEPLIKTLDSGEPAEGVGITVIPLPGVDVNALAPKINRLMQQRLTAMRTRGGAQGPMDVFSVEAEPATSSLIVAASDENLRLVRELLESLTAEGEPAIAAEQNTLIQLESAGRAEEIARAVNELYVERVNRRRGERSVSVIASERLNALVVSGTETDIAAIRELAEQLDSAEAEQIQEIRRVPLQSASATEVVDLIEDVLAGRAIGGGRGGVSATKLRVIDQRVREIEAEATIDGAVTDQVTLTADPRTNSILIKAPPRLMDLIMTIVLDLDNERRNDRVIESFRLINGDAEQMASLLGELFSLRQEGDRFVLTPSLNENDEPRGRFTPVQDVRQELAVTVDRRTNTLLVSGTRDLIDEVRNIVLQLDEVEANERERVVYNLKNAQAKEIEATLQAYFSGESDLRRETLGPTLAGSLVREFEQEVTIVGDEKSNKLVIAASPRYIDTVTQIIEELDASPPQVMIQVLLAEVTLSDDEQFGVDINLGGMVATSNFGGDGYVFDSLAGGAGVATSLGVPNFSVGSTDFTLLVRALQVQGKLEVLSRPQVQVNNNETATINVGDNIGIVDGIERRGDDITTPIVLRQDIGIELQVTPSISSDGFVRMEITPSISTLSAQTTQIDADFEAPIISQRSVETTVTVRDGETVVIGGLTQTIDQLVNTKVPLLGDIPLLGELFKSKDESSTKTELLVILTPYVIPGDEAMATVRQGVLSRRALGTLTDPRPVLESLGRETTPPPQDLIDDISSQRKLWKNGDGVWQLPEPDDDGSPSPVPVKPLPPEAVPNPPQRGSREGADVEEIDGS